VEAGALAEFSFFFLTHATLVGLTHVDSEAHRAPRTDLDAVVAGIRAATPDCAVLSSDCGVSLLPPPVEGLREFLLLLAHAGFAQDELRLMVADNPARLFRVGPTTPTDASR
jgi:hypothetical protein